MSLAFNLRNFCCLSRQRTWAMFSSTARIAASRSLSRRVSLHSKEIQSLTGIPSTLHFPLLQAHLEQRFKSSLSKTMQVSLQSSQQEQGYILKLDSFMRNARK